MANKIPIAAVAAGAAGSPYLAVLLFAASATTTGKALTEANFAGLGKYVPGWCYISMDPTGAGTADLQMTTDGGTTWKNIFSAAAAGAGGLVYIDSGGTWRIVITTTTADLAFFPLGG